VSAPSGDKCQVSASHAPATYPAAGGAGTVTIGAGRECTWSVAPETSWVSLTGATNGQGNGTVSFTVAPNAVPSVRTGNIVVEGARLQLTQAAATCTFELSRSGDTIGAAGGPLAFGVSTLAGCSWNAASNASWIAVDGTASRTGSGTVGLIVAPNGGATRVAQVSAGGRLFSVTQSAQQSPSPPAPSPGPSPSIVEFEGAVAGLAGNCPTLTFSVNGTPVVTGASTDFRRGGCRDVSNGDRVKVRGIRRADGVVEAGRIELRNNDRDDDDD
jgi:hypothetical protein